MAKPIVKVLKTFLDDRGYLYEILRSDDKEFEKFGQLYLSTINPNTIKAFHIHREKTDHIVCVEGQVKLVCIDDVTKEVSEFHLSPMAPKLVTVPPGVWHGWMCVGTTPALLISVTTEPFFPDKKDEERVPAVDNPWHYKWEIKNG